MYSGIEEKIVEDKLRDNVVNLETEITKLKKENESIKEENEYLKRKMVHLEKLKETTDKIIEIQKSLLGKSDSDKLTLDDFVSRQKRIFQNKVNHGFNVTNIYQEARYILEETAELMRAIEKNDRENMIEELADIIIFAYGCAEVARLGDLDTEIFKKMAINENREYRQTSEGDFVKTGNNN